MSHMHQTHQNMITHNMTSTIFLLIMQDFPLRTFIPGNLNLERTWPPDYASAPLLVLCQITLFQMNFLVLCQGPSYHERRWRRLKRLTCLAWTSVLSKACPPTHSGTTCVNTLTWHGPFAKGHPTTNAYGAA